jgi:polyisoprenoid-binding protein YceI
MLIRQLLRPACGLSLLLIPAIVRADIWQLDPAHSTAQFSVRHMGISTVRGAFTKVSGTMQYDPSQVSNSSVEISIDTNSVDTRVDRRDNDLRSDHFFDIAKYPTITFKSSRVESAGAGKLKVVGDLTIHGVTKPVTLDVEGPTEPVKDPRGNLHLGASATTKINRADFGMTNMTGVVGSDIGITIDVEFTKPAGGSAGQKSTQ